MLKRLYKAFTAVAGHSRPLNRLANLHPDNDIELARSADIKKKSEIYGNVIIEGKSTIGSGCTVQGNVRIGPTVHIAQQSKIRGNVEINRGTRMNGRNEIIGDVSVGKYCAIAPRARMRTLDHPTHRAATQMQLYERIGSKMEHVSQGPIHIGHDVWVCADAKILSDVSIGNGAVIGADSVVVDDVEPYSIVAGNPASHKGYRFDPQTRDTLQQLQWWNWEFDKIKDNKQFFEADLRTVEDITEIINS